MINNKSVKISIFFVCVALGFMLSTQFKITRDTKKVSLNYQRLEDLSERLKQSEREKQALANQVKKLEESNSGEVLLAEIQRLKLYAALTPVSGPGVIVSLSDSKLTSKPGENQNLFLIHDDDLLKVINELRAAGAEAIAINEQRLIGTSEIRCAGPTVSVNNSRFSPPYVIRAIGDPKSLDAALKMRGGVVETLKFWGINVSTKIEEKVLIPAFKGQFVFEYAKKPIVEGSV